MLFRSLQHKKHCCKVSEQVDGRKRLQGSEATKQVATKVHLTKVSCSDEVACALEEAKVEVQAIDEVDVAEEVPFHEVVPHHSNDAAPAEWKHCCRVNEQVSDQSNFKAAKQLRPVSKVLHQSAAEMM